MNKEEILLEMVIIYKKYFSIVEQLGAITMSPYAKERLEFLEKKSHENEH